MHVLFSVADETVAHLMVCGNCLWTQNTRDTAKMSLILKFRHFLRLARKTKGPIKSFRKSINTTSRLVYMMSNGLVQGWQTNGTRNILSTLTITCTLCTEKKIYFNFRRITESFQNVLLVGNRVVN